MAEPVLTLLDTADPDQPGSMRAYAGAVGQALAESWARAVRVYEKSAPTPLGRWMGLVSLPLRARAAADGTPWVHVLDGSRSFVGMALPRRQRLVITVHDLIPWLQAQGRFRDQAPQPSALARQLWRLNLRVCRRADLLICDSASSQKDLLAACPSLTTPTVVIPLPVRRELAVAADAPDSAAVREPGLMLHVGNDAFYKNRPFVLDVFARCRNARALWMVGPRPRPQLLAKAEALGIVSRIRWLVDGGDDELIDAYRRASLLLFPSLYEGYGWPPLEAMRFGLPVLASDRGSLPEILGPCGPGLDPEVIDPWIARAEALLEVDESWQALSARCRTHASAFNQERFRVELLAAYRSVGLEFGP